MNAREPLMIYIAAALGFAVALSMAIRGAAAPAVALAVGAAFLVWLGHSRS